MTEWVGGEDKPASERLVESHLHPLPLVATHLGLSQHMDQWFLNVRCFRDTREWSGMCTSRPHGQKISSSRSGWGPGFFPF